MAHNIATINGKKSFVAGRNEKAWHNLGTVVENCMSWQEAMEKANLNWLVEKKPLYDVNGKIVPAWGIFRDIDNAFLGCVGERYETIQNQYAFEFINALIGDENNISFDTAGALGNGEIIFCSAYLPAANFEIVEGDLHQTYLLFKSSHDGSLSAIGKLTDIRVVCNNTLNMALQNGGQSIKIKHTKNAKAKLDFAKTLITSGIKTAESIRDKMKQLTEKKVTKETMEEIFKKLFPSKDDGELATRTKNNIIDVLNLYESNDKNMFPEIRGTAYNLLNACTEYSDKIKTVKGGDEKARAESALFGSGEKFKSDALEIIYNVASKNMPNMVKQTVVIDSNSNHPVDNILSMVNI